MTTESCKNGASTSRVWLLGGAVWSAKWRNWSKAAHDTRIHYSHGRTFPPCCLALARWAGWSAVQVGPTSMLK